MAIFLITHPRSASTATERSFMSRKDTNSIHEPFGEPYYYGPERLNNRYSQEQVSTSEYKNITYAQVMENLNKALEKDGKDQHVFVKDMAQYIIPYDKDAKLSSSFDQSKQHTNVTILPDEEFSKFNYVILIRSPHLSVPSYYTCCIPPKNEKTGFDHYRSDEAGYRELRKLYDYWKNNGGNPLIIDAEDLAKDPKTVLQKVCEHGNIPFDESMLSWSDNDENVKAKFAKWPGFHDDAMKSTGFRIKENQPEFKVDWDQWEKDWAAKFDAKGVAVIRKSVQEHLDDYLYLRQNKFCV